jgi:transcriptional regulator with XRE-family HTH domain
MSDNLGQYLRHLREQQGLSTRQAADILGCSHSLIARFETGDRTPQPARLWQVAEAPFAVNKISTQAYHDIILPRAWDSKMDLNYPSERDFMLDQFRTRFDEVAGNIAGAMEQLAIVAEQEQNRKA